MTRSIALPKVRGSAALVLGAAALLFATSGEVGRSGTTPTAAPRTPRLSGGEPPRAQPWRSGWAQPRVPRGFRPSFRSWPPLSTRACGTARHEAQRTRVGFFQMRVSVWNAGEYRGFPAKPQLQVKWFIDHAIAAKVQRLARGAGASTADPSSWGEWIADVERPARTAPWSLPAPPRGGAQPAQGAARSVTHRFSAGGSLEGGVGSPRAGITR